MSAKTYIAMDGETVFDLAIKLYSDARGVSDIILLNPGLDLNATTYAGQSISYDDSIVYKKEVFVVPIPEPPRANWKTRYGQTVYDLALQLYGDISNLGKVLTQVLSLDDPIVNSEISTGSTDNYLANSLFSRKIVATSSGEEELTLEDYWQWESGEFVQWESGDYLELE